MVKNALASLANYEQKIDILRSEADQNNRALNILKSITVAISVALCLVIVILILFLQRISNRKKKLSEALLKAEQLEKQYVEMSVQKQIAERMNLELELEREGLINAKLLQEDKEPTDVISEAIFMKAFRDVAEKHIEDSDYSIEQFAKELGVSRAQLFRKIKKESGSSPNDLFQAMRLEKAKQLLQAGNMDIAEIAYAVGFSSPSYFSKCYKDRFGRVPSDV